MTEFNARSGGWRQRILQHFVPEVASTTRLTVALDPDHLVVEEGVVDSIRATGFDVVIFDDPVAFRYVFESRHRAAWDRGDETSLLVIAHDAGEDGSKLPYDVLAEGRRARRVLPFSLGDLFPTLSQRIVGELDRRDFDALFQAQERHQPGPLGENATADFILRHVFEVAPELIASVAELLRVLLRRHHQRRAVPAVLDERLIQMLSQSREFRGWPLAEIVPGREAFVAFLQERWPAFVRQRVGGVAVTLSGDEPGLRYPGPALLPFDHDDARVYIDTLFLEGVLTPMSGIPRDALRDPWMAVGVRSDEAEDANRRLARLTETLREHVPGDDASHTDWAQFAMRWAEWERLRWTNPPSDRTASDTLHDVVEARLLTWLVAHFATLSSLSYLPRPTMVHHIPRYLAHGWPGSAMERRALIVVDGLSLGEWIPLRESLQTSSRAMEIVQDAVFAWIPTITSVSRQSIFAGEPPFYFGASIGSTGKEEQHWRRFWEDRGLARTEIVYLCQRRQEPDEAFLERVGDAGNDKRVRMLGFVVGTVDAMLHGTVTGSSGLQAQIRHWANISHFSRLVERLLDLGFEVFVTADHGNIEATGIGRPNEGAIADERGERAHIFPSDLLRHQVAVEFPGAIEWSPAGLPDAYKPLIAPGRQAFIPLGARTVCHGGLSLEEVMVPFVRITAR